MKTRSSLPSAFVSMLYVLLSALPVLGMVLHAPDITIHGWWTIWDFPKLSNIVKPGYGFSHRFEWWFDQNLGFRGVAAYADNSVLYHVFGETKPNAPVKLGTGGMILNDEDTVYFSKTDVDMPKDARVMDLAARVDAMQRRLATKGAALIPIIIPSKSTMYPELMSKAWSRDLGYPRPTDTRIYTRFRDELKRRNVSFVDARELLLDRDNPALHTLNPPPKDVRHLVWGLDARHWTFFGACLTIQKVLGLYTQMTGKPLKAHECELRMVGDMPSHYDDYDLIELLNVWGVPPQAKVVPRADHPDREIDPKLQANAPSMLIVGTSFNWIVLKDTQAADAVKDVHFIYYNRLVVTWPSGKQEPLDTKTELWRRATLGKQLYILDLYETYLPADYTFKFLDDLDKALDEGQVPPPPEKP